MTHSSRKPNGPNISNWGTLVLGDATGILPAGLTKREYFAGLVLQGYCANPETFGEGRSRAQWSVDQADALLEALAQGGEQR